MALDLASFSCVVTAWWRVRRQCGGRDDVAVLETGLRRSGPAEWFEVVYGGEDGAEQQLPWQEMPQAVDGLSRPARAFRSYRGPAQLPWLVLVSQSGAPDRVRVLGRARPRDCPRLRPVGRGDSVAAVPAALDRARGQAAAARPGRPGTSGRQDSSWCWDSRLAEAARDADEQRHAALARRANDADRRYEKLLAALTCSGFIATDAGPAR